MKFKNVTKLFFVLSLGAILFAYQKLPETFYQQDEWRIIGQIKSGGYEPFLSEYTFAEILSGQGRILALPPTFFLFQLMPFSAKPLAYFSIVFHFLNTLLVFFMIKKVSKNPLIALIGGLFFSVASISHQAVTWFATNIPSLPSATFIFLSLIYYLKFLNEKSKVSLVLSFVFCVTSLYFKEAGLFLFVFYPLLYFLNSKRKSLTSTFKIHLPFFLYLTMIAVLRTGYVLEPKPGGVFVSNSPYVWDKLIFYTFLFPYITLSQVFIHPQELYRISDYIEKINYSFLIQTPVSALVAQTVISDMVSIVFSTIALVIFSMIYLYNKEERKTLIFGFLLCLLSFIPYIVLDRGTAYLESRYYYVGVAGAAILFATFLESTRKFLVERLSFPKSITLGVILVSTFFFLLREAKFIRKDLEQQVLFAQQRLGILSTIKKVYPILPEKPVFYITGDGDFSGLKIPFQQGPGYTLMVYYYETGKVPKDLLKANFLWGMADQGYQEVGDKGFGYFSDLDILKKEVKGKKIKKENVISFFYNSKGDELIDITEDVRGRFTSQ